MWPLRVKVREYVYYPRKRKSQDQPEKQKNMQEAEAQQQHLPPRQQLPQVSGITTNNMFNVLTDVDVDNPVQQ